MTDRELRDASTRMHAVLRRVPVPELRGRHRRPAVVALAAAAAVLLLVGGWALLVRDGAEQLDAAAAPTTSTAAPGACAVTTPAGGFVPPAPWPAEAPQGRWHGTADLWVDLPLDGHHWDDLPAGSEGGFGQKLFWWSRHFDAAEEPEPALTVTARRLDAEAPLVVETPGTNGSRADMGSFMLVGIELPSAGCWEIIGSYRGAELSYVASVS